MECDTPRTQLAVVGIRLQKRSSIGSPANQMRCSFLLSFLPFFLSVFHRSISQASSELLVKDLAAMKRSHAIQHGCQTIQKAKGTWITVDDVNPRPTCCRTHLAIDSSHCARRRKPAHDPAGPSFTVSHLNHKQTKTRSKQSRRCPVITPMGLCP